jgi:MGT family glycosyltransferase
VPPFGPGLPRHPGAAGAALATVLRVTTRFASQLSRRAINGIRAMHGLPPIAVAPGEFIGTMPLSLIPASRRFDYDRHDVPSSIHYVGPYLWNRPRTQAPTPWLADLRRDVPCVHVTEGTVHVQKPFVLQAALAGLGGLAMTVVATTGGERTVADLGIERIPSNARIESWVSHADLLPLTDVMVTTGGAGSVLASLAAGVPLVIVPTEWDKPEIAQRVVEAGAGVRLAPQKCTPERLRECVLRILRDSSFRENARALAGEFAELSGAPRAAALLVELSRASQRGPVV